MTSAVPFNNSNKVAHIQQHQMCQKFNYNISTKLLYRNSYISVSYPLILWKNTMLLFTFHLNRDLRCVDCQTVMAFSLASSKRTHLKDDFYAIGALKWGIYEINSFEDDLEAFLGKNSIICTVLHTTPSWSCSLPFKAVLYTRTSKRNTLTVAYRGDGSPSISCGQIEVFFKATVGSKTS